MTDRSLGTGFLNSSEKFPDRHALEVDGKAYTYGELRNNATALAATIRAHRPNPDFKLTAVLAHRSITAFSGILGALLRGHGYVPLNPDFPADRTANMLARSKCSTLIVGNEAIESLRLCIDEIDTDVLLILPHTEDATSLRAEFPDHEILDQSDLLDQSEWTADWPAGDECAYLLFTSGSTGLPKGVEVSHDNIRRFIDVVRERYAITEHDRFSQMFELVFDLSLFDLFVAWECGACVCCPSRGDARLPAKFMIESKLTMWFSVPSLGLAMKQMRMLRPGLFPTLRVSLFCGEALLADVTNAWSAAAPNSIVENLYGPTEVTLSCTWYRWDPDSSPAESIHGIVPIGDPFPGMTAMVADDKLVEVDPGEQGELLFSGPQVATGYWDDPDKTAAAFVIPPGKSERYYRTGDLVRRPHENEPIHYLGRIDHQVKIRGNRVELGEIEEVLRTADGVEVAVALGWPISDAGVEGVVAFIQGDNPETDDLLAIAADRLPSYMVPREVRTIEALPLNPNGKIDRKALLKILENER